MQTHAPTNTRPSEQGFDHTGLLHTLTFLWHALGFLWKAKGRCEARKSLFCHHTYRSWCFWKQERIFSLDSIQTSQENVIEWLRGIGQGYDIPDGRLHPALYLSALWLSENSEQMPQIWDASRHVERSIIYTAYTSFACVAFATILHFQTLATCQATTWLVQPVPWKMRLEMLN